MNWWSLFFSFHGRLNRAKYWLALLVFFVVGAVLSLLGIALYDAVTFRVVSFLVDVAVLVASTAVYVKRLHDLDRSAWWLFLCYLSVVLIIVAALTIMWAAVGSIGETRVLALFLLKLCLLGGFAIGIWFFVELGFRRGSAGYNRFGANPLGNRR